MVTRAARRTPEESPTAEVVAMRARELSEALRPFAYEAEKQRRVPEEAMRIVRESGLLRVVQPKSCGGYELGFRTHLDVVSTVAEGCSAVAWVMGVGHVHSWMVGHMGPAAQQEVYGEDPDTLVSAVIAPRGKAVEQADGSWVLDGFWPFGSGCENATWLLLGAQLTDRHGTPAGDGDLLVPTADVEIKDDWYVAGLQGTGSCSLVTKGLKVPAHRKLQLDAWLERRSPGYDAPDSPVNVYSQSGPVLAIGIAAPALGMAKAALAEFLRVAPGKKVVYTPHISHEWIPNQVALGHAASMIHAADLMLYRVADDIDEWAAKKAQMPLEMRGRIRSDTALAARFCRDAVQLLYTNGGAAGLALTSPIQRAARDTQAANMHGLLLLEACEEVYGRILLGLGSNSPIY